MKYAHQVLCHEYVQRPFERVRNMMRYEPLNLMRRAIRAAAERSETAAEALHVDVDGTGADPDAHPYVRPMEEEPRAGRLPPVARLEIGWEAGPEPGRLPSLHLELVAWPLSPTETQIEIAGEYRPSDDTAEAGEEGDPDARAAVAAPVHPTARGVTAGAPMQRFLDDVVAHIRQDLDDAIGA